MFLMQHPVRKSAKAEDVNWGPLSVVKVQGFPSQAKTEVRNARTVGVVAVGVNATSGHLLK